MSIGACVSVRRGTLGKRLSRIWDDYLRGGGSTFRIMRDLMTETEKMHSFCEGRATGAMREALEFYIAALEECADAVQTGMATKGLLLGCIPDNAEMLVEQADELLQALPEQLPDFLCDIG